MIRVCLFKLLKFRFKLSLKLLDVPTQGFNLKAKLFVLVH